MKKRLLALILSVTLLSTAIPQLFTVQAAEPSADKDVFKSEVAAKTDSGFRLDLSGVWEVVEWTEAAASVDSTPYEPTKSLDGLPNFNSTVNVPSDLYSKEGFEQSSRAAFKTTFTLDSVAGNYYIDFDGTNWIASVFVNQTYCGYKKGPRMPWKCDITNAVKAGDNELVIVVKSPKYAIDIPGSHQINKSETLQVKGKADKVVTAYKKLSELMHIDWNNVAEDTENAANHSKLAFIAPITVTSKGDTIGTNYGLTDELYLVSDGATKAPYITDAFIKTDVCDDKFQITADSKKLSAEVTFYNPTATEKTVSVAADVKSVSFKKEGKTYTSEKVYGKSENIAGLTAQNVTIPANSSKTVTVFKDVKWADAKLWWPDCSPTTANMYNMKFSVKDGDKVASVYDQQFGFRDIKVDGVHIRVNGVVRKFWNALSSLAGNTSEAMLANFKANYNRFERFGYDLGLHSSLSGFYGHTPSTAEQIQWCDFMGIPLRVCSMIDGMGADYAIYLYANDELGVKPSINQTMFDNFEEQLKDMAIQRRNNPSNIVYSLENEFLFINANNIYQSTMKDIEAACLKHMVKPVAALDSTRPSMFDGGGAGMEQQFGIFCHHYLEEQEIKKNSESLVGKKSVNRWEYDGKRPFAAGEVAFFSGDFDTHCWIGGADAGNSYTDCVNAYAKYMKTLYSKYRWNDVAMTCAWIDSSASKLSHSALHPLAVIREDYTSTFFASKGVTYKVKAFNDTFSTGKITVKWSLIDKDNKVVQSGSFDNLDITPGLGKELTINIAPINGLVERTDYTLRLESSQAGNKGVDGTEFEATEAFLDDQTITAFPKQAKIKIKKTVYAYNTSTAVNKYLKSIGVKVKKVKNFYTKKVKKVVKKKGKVVFVKKKVKKNNGKVAYKKVKKTKIIKKKIKLTPKTYKQKQFFKKKKQIVIVGAKGYKSDDSTTGDAAAVTRYARDGGRVIVLEQTVDHMYYSEADNKNHLPIKLQISMDAPVKQNYMFGQGFDRPILSGLKEKDLSQWNGAGKTTENLWGVPTGSVRSWIKGGSKMAQSALLEVPTDNGLMLLSQMRIGSKINVEPVAQVMLRNMLNYSISYKLNSSKVGILSNMSDAIVKNVKSIGVKTVTLTDVASGLDLKKTPILFIEANESNLKALNANKAKVDEYVSNGGWIMFINLTNDAKALTEYNTLLGTQHIVRPFRREASRAYSDWTTIGLSTSDYQLFTREIIAPWANKAAVSSVTWSYCVDATENMTPFFDFEANGYGNKYNADPNSTNTGNGYHTGYDRNPATIADGLYNEDFWHYIWQMFVPAENFPTADSPLTLDSLLKTKFELPKEEAIDNVVIYNNNNYEKFFDASVTVGNTTVDNTLDIVADREVKFDMKGAKGKHIDIKIKTLYDQDNIKNRYREETIKTGSGNTEADFTMVTGSLFGISEININRVTPQWYKDANVTPLNSSGSLVKYPRGADGNGGFILNNLNFNTASNRNELSTSMLKKQNVLSTILYNIGAVYN